MYENKFKREKIYFNPGDVVRIRQNIDNRPNMLVKTVDKHTLPGEAPTIEGDKSSMLMGVTCVWFDKSQVLQKYRFSTKDLEKVPN